MVLASFMADSLSLGVHWIYDTEKIASEYGRVETFLKPKENSYHPTKDKGEFTHYGDQQLVLLESVAASNGFDLNDFSDRWQGFFQDYNGYFDAATKGTLRNFSKGKGPEASASPSDDLADGDNAARGMAVGMILGAYLGENHLPEPWVSELKKGKDIQHLLSQIG